MSKKKQEGMHQTIHHDKITYVINIFKPLDQASIDGEILDHAHESIYYQPIYFQ